MKRDDSTFLPSARGGADSGHWHLQMASPMVRVVMIRWASTESIYWGFGSSGFPSSILANSEEISDNRTRAALKCSIPQVDTLQHYPWGTRSKWGGDTTVEHAPKQQSSSDRVGPQMPRALQAFTKPSKPAAGLLTHQVPKVFHLINSWHSPPQP